MPDAIDRHRHAFRRALEKNSLSRETVRQYVGASGRLLRFCEARGHDLYAGEVPASLLEDFDAELSGSNARRARRGAALFTSFLRDARDVPLPELASGKGEALDRAQLQRFLTTAASEPEPYATLMQLLPMSGLLATELSRLTLEDVRDEGERLELLAPSGAAALDDDAGAVLRAYLDGWRASFEPESATLFPARSSKPVAASTLSRRLQRIQRAAGLPEFRITALSDLHAIQFDAAAARARGPRRQTTRRPPQRRHGSRGGSGWT